MRPFLVLALPRSRTAWLSQFLSYGDYTCGHDELRHMRSLDDVKAWFAQGPVGSAETAAAQWWRLFDEYAPDMPIVVVRRDPEVVIQSMLAIPGVGFDEPLLRRVIHRLDKKLDQAEARLPNVLSVNFDDLATEVTCRAVWEHCLPYEFDKRHWETLSPINIQVNMMALMRYCGAYSSAMERLALVAKNKIKGAVYYGG